MKPLVKWVGGKTRLLPVIRSIIDAKYGGPINNYYEPCFGGGALFFDIHERIEGKAFLNDINISLMQMYLNVRNEPHDVRQHLEVMAGLTINGHAPPGHVPWGYTFMKMLFNKGGSDITSAERSALLLGLLYLGFNGLWRVNKKGEFNTPEGRGAKSEKHPKGKPRVLADFPFARLQEASEALQKSQVLSFPLHKLYLDSDDIPGPGDVEFYDPPYLATFTGYDKSVFGPAEHRQLVVQAKAHAARGALVICCGHNNPVTWDIYGKPTRVVSLERTVGASLRNKAEEALYVFGA